MKWDVRIALCLCLILVLLALQGCSQPVHTLVEPGSENATATASQSKKSAADASRTENGPPDFSSIALMLGCVFAPDSCEK